MIKVGFFREKINLHRANNGNEERTQGNDVNNRIRNVFAGEPIQIIFNERIG